MDEDSGSGLSVDDPPRGRARNVDHRWRSLDRRTTGGGEYDTRRRSADRILDSPELSKRAAAVRVRSVDPRTSPDPRSSPCVPPDPAASDVPDRSDSDDGRSTEDLTLDIDSALAEVMSEIESLGLGRGLLFSGDSDVRTGEDEFTPDSPSSDHKIQTSFFADPPRQQEFEDAPDLVIGLPVSSAGTESSPKSLLEEISSQLSVESLSSSDSVATGSSDSVASPSRALTAAEMFANANQSTIKKAASGSCPHAGASQTPPPVPAAQPGSCVPGVGRPVPATRARSVDAGSDGSRQPSSPRPHPVPKAKPARRCDVGAKSSFSTLRPDVEFVRAIVPPFGDAPDVPTKTFTLPRDAGPSAGRGTVLAGGSGAHARAEVSRSMSVGDATCAVTPRPGTDARDPSPAAVKPPVKVKPPVMKKPARAGEVIKRLQESLSQQGGVGVSAPQ